MSNTNRQDASQGNLVVNVPVNAAIANGGGGDGKPDCGCQEAWNPGSKDGSQSGVDQSNGGVQESNGNLNATSQVVSQDESSSQQSSGGAAGGGSGKDSFDKGPSDTSGQSSDQHENVSNHNVQQADQHNAVVNVPINVAALNTGGVDQRNGGVDESNGNFNATGQYVWQDESSTQSSSSDHSYGKDDCRCSGSDDRAEGATPSQHSTQHESVSNSNHQSADQSNLTGNVPVNAALLNGGGSGCKCDVGKGDGGKGGVDQRNGGVDESNGNLNATGQYVWQDESSTQSSSSDHSYGKDDCRCSGGDDRAEGATPSQHSTQHESVSNSNHQSADQSNLTGNVPVNAALLNSGSYGGKQTFGKDGVSQQNGGVDESNGNLNVTKQVVHQSETSTQSSKGGEGDRGKWCPKQSSCQPERCKPTHCKPKHCERPNRDRCPQVK